MKQNIFPDYAALCAAAAGQVVQQLRHKPDSVLVFPTGNTPLGLFKRLVELKQSGQADFGRAHVVVLDEYAGLPPDDPRSLADWLKRELLSPVGLPATHIHGFENGTEALEGRIKSLGGLDLVILGLGRNGHLGFNEPGSAFDSRARKVSLAPESIASNAAYWGSEDRVPRHGYTLGIGTLIEARTSILLVSGSAKRAILAASLEGEVTPAVPASVLRTLSHAHLFADANSVQSKVR